MEEVKKASFVVYEVDENESMVACLGLSEKRSDELEEIVRDAHMKADRISEAADLMSRYANNATELWYMAFIYGCATAESRGSDPIRQIMSELIKLKRKSDDDDSN